MMSLLLLMIAPLFLNLFKINEETRILSELTIVVCALYMIPKVINHLMIVGVMRGGGDTLFAAIIDVAAPWLIGMPMAFLGVRVLGWPLYLVMALINLEELTKACLGIWRLLSGKWLHNLVKDEPQGHLSPEPETA